MKERIYMNKKNLETIILLIIIVVLISIIFVLIKNKSDNKQETKQETYVAYVKINPLVKLTFDVNYKCNKENKCETVDNKVTNVDLLNDDAKSIYTNLSYKDKKLEEVVASLIDIADENNKDISNVSLSSTYEFNKDELVKTILSSLKTTKNVEINYNYQKEIDESSMIETTPVPTTTQTSTTTTIKTTSKCVSKKFKKKYTYAYKTKDECKKEGNNAFNNITDNVDDSIFSYGCEEIKDDCGDTWYGVIFYKWSEEKGEYPYYY